MNPIMTTPRAVDIDITTQCNLRCKYCYHFTGPGDVARDLPTDDWLKFFAELGRCQVLNVTLAGGEPFFRTDLKVLLQSLVDNRMRYSLLSNGTLIDDDIAEFIAKSRRCDSVQVSIDGSTAEIHDKVRGKGQFAKALAGIRCLQRHQIAVTSRVTINRWNVGDLANIAHLLLEELNLRNFSTNVASCMGSCRLHMEELALDLQARMLAMATLAQLEEQYPGRITANAGPLAELHMWQKMEAFRLYATPTGFIGGSLTACGCVWEKIAVRADGVIVPCAMLSHIELGRINRDDFGHIWRDHPEMLKMRNRSKISLRQFDFCRDCEYIDSCTGNCPSLAYELAGDVHHPSPDACLRRFLIAGGKLPAQQETV